MLQSPARLILTILTVLLLLTSCLAGLLAAPNTVAASDICRICYAYGGGEAPRITRTWDFDEESLTIITSNAGDSDVSADADVTEITEDQAQEIVEAFNKYGVFTWQSVSGPDDSDDSGIALTVTYRSGDTRTIQIGSQQPPHFADVMEVLLRNSTAAAT